MPPTMLLLLEISVMRLVTWSEFNFRKDSVEILSKVEPLHLTINLGLLDAVCQNKREVSSVVSNCFSN